MGALSGLKVLDFSTLMPGPAATMWLADMGADVIKICSGSRPDLVLAGGNKIEGSSIGETEAMLDRNKRSMTLNLKTAEAQRVVKALVSTYDIVVEQFRPGVMKKFGLGYDDLRAVNPRVIYCSLTGYGQYGPNCMKAGHDINYIARSGLASYAGRPGEPPSCWGSQVADLGGGSEDLIIGLLAAVYARSQKGKGQYVDVSMYEGALFWTIGVAGRTINSGYVPQPGTERTSGSGMYDYYETKDGRYFAVGAMEPKFWKAACTALGVPELIEGGCNPEELGDSKEVFAQAFKSRTYEEILGLIDGVDACIDPVLTMDEVIDDSQVKAREMFVDVPFQNGKPNKQLATPIKFSETPNEYRFAANPVGHDTEDIMRSLGYTQEECEALRAAGVFS